MMIKVGLVGEDPNDTLSIKNLLGKKYKGKIHFIQLAKRVKGYQLDNPKIKKSLPIEFIDTKCSFIIYIRDLDGFESQKAIVKNKIKWFKDLDAVINKEGILLLNIWELEALILGDIDTFNKIYRTQLKFKSDPHVQKDPKELLKRITFKTNKQFRESHCPDIFDQLEIWKVEKNCRVFKDFIQEFDKKIA